MLDNQREHHLSFPLDMRSTKEIYECDDCGNEFDEDTNYVKECKICEGDYCEDCQDEHAKYECGF